MIRYTPHAKAYCCWNHQNGHIVNSYHIRFIEHLNVSPKLFHPGQIINSLEPVEDDIPVPDPSTIPNPKPTKTSGPCRSPQEHKPMSSWQETCNGLNTRQAVAALAMQSTMTGNDMEYDSPKLLSTLLVNVEDPDAPTWKEAMASNERGKWMEGMCEELCSLKDMDIFEVIPKSDIPSF